MDQNYRDVQAKLAEVCRQLHLEGLRERGEASLRVENWQEAVEILEELCRLDPLDTSVIAKLEEAKRRLELKRVYREAMKHFEKGRWGKAEAALEKAVSLDPGYRDAAAKLEIVRERWSQSSPLVRFLTSPVLASFANVAQVIAFIVAAVPVVIGLAIAVPRIVGSVVATPTPKPPTLCNGTFDDKFECWVHGGELEQSVKCEEGQCYAVLGSPDYKCEGGVPVGEAWIKQSFQVPQTISPTLSLRYRIFSFDLDLYDFFQVSINGNPVGQFGNVDWDTPGCDRELWDSGWQVLEFDLNSYKGQEIEVLLRNVNREHAWWNTWVHIDDVGVDSLGGSH